MPTHPVLRALAAACRQLTLVAVVLGVVSAAPPALAWGPTGHMIVAEIAYQHLGPEARAEADRLIAILASSDPRLDHFVPASVWMDAVRGSGLRAFDNWHYINLPINAGGLPSVAPAATPNVVWAIDQAAATLASPKATDFEKAFMLRVLLHLVGDVHQPLHTVGRFTADLPAGDRGGNDFPLALETARNLHWLWDDLVGLAPRLDPDGDWQAEVAQWVREIEGLVPVPPAELVAWHEGSAAAWAREGFVLAGEVVYQGIEEGGVPSEDYRRRAHGVIRERLVLAGLRLAAMLEASLGAEPPAELPPLEAAPVEAPSSLPAPDLPLPVSAPGADAGAPKAVP